MFVFNMLPKIYTDVCKNKPKMVEKRRIQPARSLVTCDQCNHKTSLTDMKMHIKSAHGKSKQKTPEDSEISSFVYDYCGYKAVEKTRLNQHINAVHSKNWSLQMARAVHSSVKNVTEVQNEEVATTNIDDVNSDKNTIILTLWTCPD